MPGYVYVLDGIATANGKVGISGSRSSPCENKTFLRSKHGGARDSNRFHPVHVVNNFNFNFNGLQRMVMYGRVEWVCMVTFLLESKSRSS
jgi:hypothetical protein